MGSKRKKDFPSNRAPASQPEAVISPFSLRHHVVEAGLKPRITRDDLLKRAEEIGANSLSVSEALYLALNQENKNKLAAARTQEVAPHTLPERSDHFILAVAMTVASMNLDRVSELSMPTGRYGKLKPRPVGEVRAERTTSIIAALLEEYVAYNIIDLKTVQQNFGSEVAQLTKEMAQITRIPISIRDPDSQGRMTYADARFNYVQHQYGQNLIHGTENPSRVWLVKTAKALQELRERDAIADPVLLQRMARHIQGMYLPLAREAGMKDIQEEMQDRLLAILDPVADRVIRRQLNLMGLTQVDDMGEPRIIGEIEQTVRAALKKANYVTSGIKFSGRVKHPWTIHEKRLRKTQEAINDRYEARKKKLEEAQVRRAMGPIIEQQGKLFKSGKIDKDEYDAALKSEETTVRETIHSGKGHDQIYVDGLKALRHLRDSTMVPVVLWQNPQVTKLRDVVAMRILLDDNYDVDTGAPSLPMNHRRCKRVNGIVAGDDAFVPIEGRFKDYIQNAKANNYSAMHNGVWLRQLGDKLRIELQILTASMHEANTGGLARHAAHKSGPNAGTADEDLKAIYHPAQSRLGGRAAERFSYIMDMIDRGRARVQGEALPDHMPRGFKSVSTRGGQRGLGWVVRELDDPHASLVDLANKIDTRLLARTCGVVHNGTALIIDKHRHLEGVGNAHPFAGTVSEDAFFERLRQPFAHCDFVEFITLPPVPAPVRSVRVQALTTAHGGLNWGPASAPV